MRGRGVDGERDTVERRHKHPVCRPCRDYDLETRYPALKRWAIICRPWRTSESFGQGVLVVHKPLSQADYVVDDEAEVLVEGDDFVIGGADLEIDLGAAEVAQQSFCLGHDLSAEAVALMIRRDGKVIDPAAVAFIAGHGGGDDGFIQHADQEQLRVHLKLACDVLFRIVGGTHQSALLPEGDDGGFVRRLVGADVHVGNQAVWDRITRHLLQSANVAE